jgi:urease accessory protein
VSSSPGWLGRLQLVFERAPHGTQLKSSVHEGPLRIQRVFQPEGPACPHVYLLHPPGGVVGGDRLETRVVLEPGAHALLTTPAAQKLYRSAGETAEVTCELELGEGASLDWLPSETLAFSAARATLATRVHLAARAGFIGWDTICYGMPARGEPFERGRVLSRFELYRAGTPLLLESLDLDQGGQLLDAAFALRGRPVVGNLYAVPASGAVDDDLVAAVREAIGEASGTCAVTSLGEALVVRALAPTVERLRHDLIRAWQVLRPRVLARPAVLPRVWST